MTEDELLALTLPPQVDIGNHTLDVAVLPHPDGVKPHPRRGRAAAP
ncbi:hypothetical protein [Microbacterium sp.]|nr:hypothetical protein [Microbacterium sp.]